jgi:16S rRNA (uracil1498-N3)-methyltransferase
MEAMTSAKIETRLYVTADLAEAASVGLDHAQAHYLRSVLRLSQGARIALFNGRDGEWAARLEGLGKGWASLLVEARLRAQEEEPDLWLVFAPIKRARIDFIAEKAAEFGVSRLQPVMTSYTSVSRVNCERLAANAREAAEQCGRLSVPEVADPRGLFDLLGSWPAERRLLVCAESGTAPPIAALLAERAALAGTPPGSVPRSARGPWAVMTGPEGGYAPSELDALGKLPFADLVGLGPRLLRADTAALAALACWQAILGDGAQRPPPRA